MSARGNARTLRALRTRIGDFRLGVRLAVGGSRTPWGRLSLAAIGIGLGVAVLLLASSVPNMKQARDERQEARLAGVYGAYSAGPSSVDQEPVLLTAPQGTTFRGEHITGRALQPQVPDPPVPAGLEQLPGPGEMVVSPALQDLLQSPGAELLRPRLPGEVVGVIDKEGLVSPGELRYYTGVTDLSAAGVGVAAVYPEKSSRTQPGDALPPQLWIMLAFGVVVLLVPVVVFVAGTTRLAEAARSRRLAALRLVGADGAQIRRIASGEALVGAVLGVLAGWLFFLGGRQLAGHLSILGFSTFVSDIRPDWWMALLVTLAIPVITVTTAQAAMRRTIIEPLGVVRQVAPRRHRMIWRLVPMILGVLGLLFVGASSASVTDLQIPFLGSIVLLLIGVPLVLPWAVERVVQRGSAKSLPWQLALRRLQLSSGTAARSVSAIAVVLTGIIGLQTFMATIEAEERSQSTQSPSSRSFQPRHEVSVRGELAGPEQSLEELTEALAGLPATRHVEGVTTVRFGTLEVEEPRKTRVKRYRTRATIVDCAMLRELRDISRCRNGEVFREAPQDPQRTRDRQPWREPVRPGERLSAMARHHGPAGAQEHTAEAATWQAPQEFRQLPEQTGPSGTFSLSGLVLTPQAAEEIPWWARSVQVGLDFTDSASPDAIERVRNVAAEYLDFSGAHQYGTASAGSDAMTTYALIRYGLLLGALVTFALIGCSLFVTAAEQIQERRRQMAVLAAVGTRRRTLGWAAFLQNAVPMLVAVVLACLVGLGLGMLVVGVASLDTLTFDLPGMLGLVAIAALSVLVVTALTLPALRRAMHTDGLHSE
ncbi:FtsX-like permease family protein [Halopolyspora algeriensis]|uniref:FtsX-like permease family protein n=1 Tax=Halopolyspora algeriensis TaxID=1500506 RepID=A0A368VVM4_9ACTN|nr:ABC transporter permease [Halopolyspora algeriensis]RCW46146.1 FtsX-like permease family protein [Halopolyspora algeriensis]TQM55549.1 FtsX-like permease family protein [Halopolyspora algeriensis]